MNKNEVNPYTATAGQSEYHGQVAIKATPNSQFNRDPRLSIWDPESTDSSNSHASISYVSPLQYRPSDQIHLVRMNTEAISRRVENNDMNKLTSSNNQLSCHQIFKKITSSKIVFFMTGLIVCGIPLAVFVTLWMGTISTSDSSVTVSSTAMTASVSLPIQCYTYAILNDTYRNYNNLYACCWSPYDTISTLPSGWYRIMGSAGTRLMTSPILTIGACGSNYPGYFNGTLPSTTGAIATGTACFYTGISCSYSLAPITVTNCNGYYIFYLLSTSSSNYKYCTTA